MLNDVLGSVALKCEQYYDENLEWYARFWHFMLYIIARRAPRLLNGSLETFERAICILNLPALHSPRDRRCIKRSVQTGPPSRTYQTKRYSQLLPDNRFATKAKNLMIAK